jgi:hypothetical protein
MLALPSLRTNQGTRSCPYPFLPFFGGGALTVEERAGEVAQSSIDSPAMLWYLAAANPH